MSFCHTLKVLKEARRAKIPIIFTTVIHRKDLKDMGIWAKKREIPPDKRIVAGSPGVEVDPMLEPLPDEIIIAKKYMTIELTHHKLLGDTLSK